MEAEKAKFEEEKQESERERMDAQKKALDDNSGLQARLQELKERETSLLQREAVLMARWQDLETQKQTPQSQPQQKERSPYGQNGANNFPMNPYAHLRDRAAEDGITVYTAGGTNSAIPHSEPIMATATAQQKKPGTFHMGCALFRSSIITLCIVAFESILAFFMKDFMQVPAYYPMIGFSLGFVAFLVCSVLYALNYRPYARRKKNLSYFVTATVAFIIGVIIVTMVAVYMRAQLGNPAELLSYVIVPVVYLSNILVFSAFYYMFTFRENM